MSERQGAVASSPAMHESGLGPSVDIRERGEGAQQRLIFVTNRGPVEHAFDPDGVPIASRGAGGVVSGLLCAAQDRPVSWISLA
ncbi:MAG TPA: hypothetical protein VJQ45_02675, partial [Ktedonobacterales bacterium]|nr:hypothetical protein [Ktedonobacterales bacterium]